MKKFSLILLVLVVTSIGSAIVYGSDFNEEPKIASPGYQGGTVYTGSYLRVGMNDYGALGVYDIGIGSVGFQYPIGSQYESLAYGWWGEGWSVLYGPRAAGFSPDDDAWGTLGGVVPDVSSSVTSFGYEHICRMVTNDNRLELTFRLLFFEDEKFAIMESYITNIGSSELPDLEFKRVCDWDVWQTYDNYWGKDDIRHPELKLTVAFLNTSVAPDAVYMGFAACREPDNWTLDWDEYKYRGLPDDIKYYLDIDGITPMFGDWSVIYQWLLGTLDPGETVMVPTIYAAGDSLEELEIVVMKAQEWCHGVDLEREPEPVGGAVEPAVGILIPSILVLSCLAASMTLALTSIRYRRFKN